VNTDGVIGQGNLRHAPWLFAVPAICFLCSLIVYPALESILLSMMDADVSTVATGESRFIGLQNYLTLFGDASFINSVKLLAQFAFISTTLEVGIALLVALGLEYVVHLPHWFRTALLIPMFVVPLVSGLTFRFLLDPNDGVLAEWGRMVHYAVPDLLGNPDMALWLVVLQDFWRMWPFVFLIISAGLKALPREPFEAFEVDGGSRVQAIWHLVLPLLMPTLAVAIGLKVIESLKAFTEIYVMTGGGPGESTNVLSLYIVQKAFEFFQLSQAAAAGTLLLLVGLLGMTAYAVMSAHKRVNGVAKRQVDTDMEEISP
jgi:multiple sugar transport system permease protein